MILVAAFIAAAVLLGMARTALALVVWLFRNPRSGLLVLAFLALCSAQAEVRRRRLREAMQTVVPKEQRR